MLKKLIVHILIFAVFLVFGNSANAATLEFSPSSGDFSVGDSGSLEIILDTTTNGSEKETYGTEAYIQVEGDALEFTSINAAGSVDPSELFRKEITDTQISFTILKPDSVIIGQEPIVTIDYNVVNPGTTDLSFIVQESGETTTVPEDETGNELLTGTSPGSYDTSGESNDSSDVPEAVGGPVDSSDSSSNDSNSTSTDSGSQTTEVPATGYFDTTLYLLSSLLLIGFSLFLKGKTL